MDIVGSIRKFFNRKRLFILEERRSGKIYDKMDFSIKIDEEDEDHDESLYLSPINNRYTNIYVHAYSLKDAKRRAMDMITADRGVRLAVEREERREPADQSVEAVIRSTVQARDDMDKVMHELKNAAETWQQNREELEEPEGKRQLVVHKQ